MENQNYPLGAMSLYQKTDGYGKNADTDTITIDVGLESADITAIGTGKQMLGGDLIYVYPSMISTATSVAVDTETLVFEVNYYEDCKYWLTKEITVTFSAPADLDDAVTQIIADLTTEGLNEKVAVVNAGGRLRIQAKDLRVNINITGGTALSSLNMYIGQTGIPMGYTVSKDITTSETSVGLAEFYLYNYSDFDTIDSLTGLEYKVFRHWGECTGSTLNSSFTRDDYKGSSRINVQTEFGEAEASIDVSELVWNRDNLELLEGWSKRDSGVTYFWGEAATSRYKYGSYTKLPEFSMVGFSVINEGTAMQHVEVERAKCPGWECGMSKAFRTMSKTIMLLADADRTVATVYEI